MSYDQTDAAMDEMYERIGDELYPGLNWRRPEEAVWRE